jgi:stress-induced morphogen
MRITKETQMVEQSVDDHFPKCLKDLPRAYRYNPSSIRVRIVDKQFAGLNDTERLRLVKTWLHTLSDEIQDDIWFIVLLTPDEVEESLSNAKYLEPIIARDKARVRRKQKTASNGKHRRSA